MQNCVGDFLRSGHADTGLHDLRGWNVLRSENRKRSEDRKRSKDRKMVEEIIEG